jgi:hypothetical protein
VNKKKQKNFDNFWPVAVQRPQRRGAKVFWFLRPDDEAALAAPLRSSKPDESESGSLHDSKKHSLFSLTFLIFGRLGSYLFCSHKRRHFLNCRTEMRAKKRPVFLRPAMHLMMRFIGSSLNLAALSLAFWLLMINQHKQLCGGKKAF